MSLRLEQILTEGIAQLSYLIGDDSTRTAAVIDPRSDVEVYVEKARELGLSITHIFETHIHADFVSGARELADRVGSATIYLSGEGGAKYRLQAQAIERRRSFHIRENGAYRAAYSRPHAGARRLTSPPRRVKLDTPFAVFTGDSLFVNSAGRPDLLGDDQTGKLVKQAPSHAVRLLSEVERRCDHLSGPWARFAVRRGHR